MQPRKCRDFIPDLQKVSAPMKQVKECPKYVSDLQVISLAMQPKKCPDFVLDLLVSAQMKQPKKCPKFVLDLLKVSALMKQPKKCPKFVPVAEDDCSDNADKKFSEICVQLAGHCSGDAAEEMSGFCT